MDLPRHLRVRHVLVDHDTLDELGVLKRTADFAIYLDQLEIDVLAFEVGDGEDGVNGDLSELFVRDGNAAIGLTKWSI
jgi:hypothetical protein